MEKPATLAYESCDLPARLPEKACIVIGAGRFGKRAINALIQRKALDLLIVDRDERALSALREGITQKILCDGIHFLCKNMDRLHPSNIVVPALPRHLVFEWLRCLLLEKHHLITLPVPEKILPMLPHTWAGGEGSLLISYANFQCPEDCPEPADHCTVSGEPRPVPLFDLLGKLTCQGYGVHIVRSRQLAPGLGGYKVKDMIELLQRIQKTGMIRWLIGTACRCHGVLNAMEIRNRAPKSDEGDMIP